MKINPEHIHLLSIKTIKGNVDMPDGSAVLNASSYQIQNSCRVGFLPEKKVIGLIMKVDFLAVNTAGQPVDIKGSYTHEIHFLAEDFNSYITINGTETEQNVKIDDVFLSTLVGIAYSTIRGIIFTRTQGLLNKPVLLPVINPQQFTVAGL
jgi:hypothetical protein